jgi:hypothetical protein
MNHEQLSHANILITPGRWQMALKTSLLTVILLVFSSTVWAFGTYDGCKDCHGGFLDSPYTSLQDGTNWGSSLMSGHEAFVGRTCDACHKSGSKGEVFLNFSIDGTLSKSCVGCHGRDEDVTGECIGLDGMEAECGSGAGLRQHHESQVGDGTCSGCHGGDDTPVGENILPFNYGQNDVVMEDSCDDDGSESQFGPTGLDNDGDGPRDGDDSDCEANSPPTQPGTLSASEVTANSATVTWGASSDDDDDPISYQVDYRRNGEAPWSDGGSTNTTSQQLSGLDAEQSYDVRVTPNDGTADGPRRSAMNLFETEPGGSSFSINAGHSGAWFNPVTDGQGQFIDVEPEEQFMFISWFTYTDAASDNPNEQQWYTAQGNYSGDTAVLDLFEALGGKFDDPQEVTNPRIGEVTLTFSDCDMGMMSYLFDEEELLGEFPMIRVIPGSENVCEGLSGNNTEAVDINAGMDGAWFDPATSGQGYFIDAHPAPEGGNFIFVSWFTYGNATASGQRWLTAQGGFEGSMAEIDVYEATGGSFDDPEPVSNPKVGTMSLDFTDCSNALLSYSLPTDPAEGDIAITRVIAGAQALCEELAGED